MNYEFKKKFAAYFYYLLFEKKTYKKHDDTEKMGVGLTIGVMF